jgi:hypothetical protein
MKPQPSSGFAIKIPVRSRGGLTKILSAEQGGSIRRVQGLEKFLWQKG